MTLLRDEEPNRRVRLKVPLTLKIPWQPIKSHVETRVCQLNSQAERYLRTKAAPSQDIRDAMRLPASNFTFHLDTQDWVRE